MFAYTGPERTYEQILDGSISAQEYTLFISLLRDLPDIKEGQVIAEPTSYVAFTDMMRGKTDSVFNNRSSLLYQIKSVKDMPEGVAINMTPLPENGDFTMAFTLKKGNKAVLDQINEGLNAIKENGKYDEINKKWFNTTSEVK